MLLFLSIVQLGLVIALVYRSSKMSEKIKTLQYENENSKIYENSFEISRQQFNNSVDFSSYIGKSMDFYIEKNNAIVLQIANKVFGREFEDMVQIEEYLKENYTASPEKIGHTTTKKAAKSTKSKPRPRKRPKN